MAILAISLWKSLKGSKAHPTLLNEFNVRSNARLMPEDLLVSNENARRPPILRPVRSCYSHDLTTYARRFAARYIQCDRDTPIRRVTHLRECPLSCCFVSIVIDTQLKAQLRCATAPHHNTTPHHTTKKTMLAMPCLALAKTN